MRFLYVALIALAGSALIAGPLIRAKAQAPDVPPAANGQRTPPPQMTSPPDPTAVAPGAVRVVDELVNADIVATAATPSAASPRRPATPGRHAAPARRSLLARVFFGSGAHRPRPFPHPGW